MKIAEKLKNKWLYIKIDGATRHRHSIVAINARFVGTVCFISYKSSLVAIF